MKDYLDFEQPIIELQTKLDALTRTTQTSGVEVDFEEEAEQIREKIEETRKAIYSKLTPWQRIQLARHPRRPYNSTTSKPRSTSSANCTATGFTPTTAPWSAASPNLARSVSW